MKIVKTRKGEEILVDDEDFDPVSRHTWHIMSTGYAATNTYYNRRVSLLLMHRLITAAPEGMAVDHLNKCLLDNRKRNLEIVSAKVNAQRRRTHPLTGIRLSKDGHKFESRLTTRESRARTQEHFLGSWPSFDLALLARIVGEIKFYGEPIQQFH